MKNQPTAIINVGYWLKLSVSVKDLSSVVDLLSRTQQVDSDYIDGKSVYFPAESPRTFSIEIINGLLPCKPAKPEEEKPAE